MKRKRSPLPQDASQKRVRLEDAGTEQMPPPNGSGSAQQPPEQTKDKIVKMMPARPFPTVPTSVNATGPRSSHPEGKNLICVTRKTPLGAYLRRCKDLIMKDGYKTIYLSGLGAAIPHLLLLTTSLSSVLPAPSSDLKIEIKTATVEVTDEVIPADEDEEGGLQTRNKAALHVVITVGDGRREVAIEPGRKGKGIPRGKRQRGAIPKDVQPSTASRKA